MRNSTESHNRDLSWALPLIGVWIASLMIYVVLRYGVYWGENDTGTFAFYIRAGLESGSLIFGSNRYPGGYAYQAVVIFLTEITGLSVATVQLAGGALLVVWILFPAWLLYRELTDSFYGTVVATIILFTQPEFLFVVMRGTHEKFIRGLMFLALYLFVKSFRMKGKSSRFVMLMVAFHAIVFSIITFNILIAATFIVGFGLALALLMALFWRQKRLLNKGNSRMMLGRFGLILVLSIIMLLVVILYVYQPAQYNIGFVQSIGGNLLDLILNFAPQTNPYAVVSTGWVSLSAYLFLGLANWLILLLSAIIWLGQGYQLFIDKSRPRRELLVWVFCGAFAFIFFASIIIDLSGAITANLQHRAFPSFSMLAAPLIANWIVKRPAWIHHNNTMRVTLILVFASLSILSLFKATNDPRFSNKWLFYVPSEIQSLEWANDVLPERFVWTSFDERLRSGLSVNANSQDMEIIWANQTTLNQTRDFIISDVTRARSARLQWPLPVDGDSFITYDNGFTQVYHQRPTTPYQR